MNYSAIFTLGLLIVAAGLLVSEKLRPDLIALAVLVILGLTGIVNQTQIFSGFGGSAVMTLVGISIISEGLRQTGVTQSLASLISRMGGRSEAWLILATVVVSAVLSLLMNNIAVVGVLLPAVLSASRRNRVSQSKLLLPLAYGTLLGGMATLLTTANIIVSGALKDAGYQPFGLLDFFPVGGPVMAAGILYMVTIGRRLMPKVDPAKDRQPQQVFRLLANQYQLERDLHELEVLPGSPLADRSITKGEWANKLGLAIVGITRQQRTKLAPSADEFIRAGDRILVQGMITPELLEVNRLGLNEFHISVDHVASETTTLAEVVIAPHASMIGRSLFELRFRDKYNLNVLALWRDGEPKHSHYIDLPLKFGDALLVQGGAASIQKLHQEPDLILLREDPDAVLHPQKQKLALGITLITLAVASLGILPVAVVVLAGAVLLMLTRCLNLSDAYQAIEWKVIFLIAGMWPLSIAIRSTGLADVLVQALHSVWSQVPPLGVAAILILIALVLTQFMSGQVASLVLAPLAIVAAQSIGADARALGMAVALGCSLAFPTPYGHPVNIMVMNSGNYHFRDYLRVGIPLTVLSITLILLGLSWWGHL